jgi:hypothetical protein
MDNWGTGKVNALRRGHHMQGHASCAVRKAPEKGLSVSLSRGWEDSVSEMGALEE